MKDSRSFFEKLTGSAKLDNGQDASSEPVLSKASRLSAHAGLPQNSSWPDAGEDGELTVDVFQTQDEIIIQSTVAGVKPDDLDVTITQDMVTLKGKRQRTNEVSEKDFYYKELYWGTFSRSILLPQEVDADAAQATLKNGLITIRLPKLDKQRTQKLKVKME